MKNIPERICKWWKKAATWLDSKRHLSIFIVVTFTIYIFYIPIKKLLLTKFIAPIFDDLPNNDTLRSFIVLFLLLFSICYCINHLCHKRRPSIDSTFTILLISIIYFFLFRPDKDFYYFRFLSFDIYLSDLIWLSSLLIILDYQLITLPLKQDNSYLLEDDTSQDEIDKNLLYRNNFSKTIANVINNTAPKKAIAIAILAKWGFGKTVFLRQLKNELENDNSTNIVLQFNPWKVDGNVNIIQVFFEELSEKLAKYDHSAIKNFKNYAQKLSYNTDNDLAIIKLAKSLFGSFFFNQLSITKQHDEIDRNIKRISKRVIVLIDDLDRLSGDELAPIMRLIRNVADFQNVIFVAAFDRSYVTNALSKTEKLTNEEKYLEKIFQVEIPLPPIEKTLIKQEFFQLFRPNLPMEDNNHETIEFVKILNEFTHQENNHFGNLLLSLRDIKRFTNSFKTIYSITKGNVVLRDIFLLELIKYKAPLIYDDLANQYLLEDIESGNSLEQRKLKEELFKDINIIDKSLKNEVHTILNKLFPNNLDPDPTQSLNNLTTPEISPLCIRFKRNHLSYFSYIPANLVSKYIILRSQDFNNLKQLIDSLVANSETKNSNINDYLNIIEFALDNEKSNKEWFKNTFKSLIYLSKYTLWENRIKYYFEDYIKKPNLFLNSAFNNDKNEFSKFIIDEIILEEEFDLYIRSEITLYLIKLHFYNLEIKVSDLERLIEINHSLFLKNKELNPLNEERVYNFLLLNWQEISEHKKQVSLNTKTCHEYFNYIRTNYTWYIQNLIRPYMIPETVTYQYTFDPFIPQIFGGYNEFEYFLNNLPESDCVKYNKQKYSEFKDNNFNPIIIKDFRTESPCLNNE